MTLLVVLISPPGDSPDRPVSSPISILLPPVVKALPDSFPTHTFLIPEVAVFPD